MEKQIRDLIRNTERFESACGKVTIVAATKTVDPARINRLKEYGLTIAGENRVQEFLGKYDKVTGVAWHFIGTLQTNKIRFLTGKVDLIQSAAKRAHLDEIARSAQKAGLTQDVLIEVNIGAEQSKAGAGEEEAGELLEYARALRGVRVKGLMAIPPADAPPRLYRRMRGLFDFYKDKYGLSILSMGMSGDYLTALENGANMIRVGSLIFGERDKIQE